MKKIYGIVALSLAITLLVSCSNNAKKAGKYKCPMECEKDKVYDEPGKCPACNMDLKEVTE